VFGWSAGFLKRKQLTTTNHFVITKADIYGIIISGYIKGLTKDSCPKLPKIMHFGCSGKCVLPWSFAISVFKFHIFTNTGNAFCKRLLD